MSWHYPDDEHDLYQRDVEEAEAHARHLSRIVEGVIADGYFLGRDNARRNWDEIQRRLAR